MPNINEITSAEEALRDLRNFASGRGTNPTPGYTGTGNGIIHHVSPLPTAISETWTITCTTLGGHGVAIFSVTGSVSGVQAALTVGTFYENGFIEFTIDDGSTDFATSDEFTIVVTEGVMKSQNPWVVERWWPVIIDDVTGSDFNAPALAYNGTYDDAGSMRVNASPSGTWQVEYLTAVEWDTYVVWPEQSTSDDPAENPKDWTVEYSDDGTNWAVADTVTNQTGWNEVSRTFAFGSAVGRHIYWKIDFSNNNGATDIVVGEINPWMVGDFRSHILRPQLIMKGVGLAGADNIYIGFRIFTNIARSYYTWRVAGFSAFSSTEEFDTQAGKSPNMYLVLSAIPIEYWFVVTSRRIVIVIKIGTVYTNAYLGFILPYGVPSEYSYPLFIGASDRTSTTKSSDVDVNFSSFWRAGLQCAYLKHPSGSWEYYYTKGTTTGVEDDRCVWPWSAAGYTAWSQEIELFRNNIDGSYSILPAILEQQYDTSAGWHPNMFGELEGVFWISGFDQVSENTFTLNSDNYIVFQNCFRVGRGDFFALRLD